MRHKVLLLGLGFWGGRWFELLKKTERCELAGFAGSAEEFAKARAAHGIPAERAWTDFREVISSSDAAECAMARGLHVHMEKPLAMNLGEARALQATKSARPSHKFMTSQNYRWKLHNQAIKAAITGGLLGKVESIFLEFRKQEDLQGYQAGLVKPLLQNVSIHHFDLIRFFSGADCREVYCRTWRPGWSAFIGEPSLEAS
ncbi:MAG: hypothetical protein ABSF43_14030 [Rectinemataceae bacterium]